jgi:hypothetical protein
MITDRGQGFGLPNAFIIAHLAIMIASSVNFSHDLNTQLH